MSLKIRFLADGMLGKLTRWLRMLGYDVEYIRDSPDEKLVERAEKERRVLLTSDLHLYRRALRRGIRAHLVEGRKEAEKIAGMAGRFKLKLKINPESSLCPRCNSPLREAEASVLRSLIPASVLRKHQKFWVCTNSECGKVYWKGSHWNEIDKILEEARSYLRKNLRVKP
jgi:hypothetical protein